MDTTEIYKYFETMPALGLCWWFCREYLAQAKEVALSQAQFQTHILEAIEKLGTRIDQRFESMEIRLSALRGGSGSAESHN